MKVVGIITEFNPFHKGHEYIIKKAKETTGADYCIIITSGNFVQRGEPSFVDKYTKTFIALKHGADLVIELPVQFATASAEYFATCAVSILNNMGIVNYLAFGVEDENIEILENIVEILNNEQDEYKIALRRNVSSGLNYASARAKALAEVLKNDDLDFINKPNNILALEYLKALKKLNSSIEAVGIKRIKADYHEEFSDTRDSLCASENRLFSASNIRKLNDEALKEILLSIDNEYLKNFGTAYPLKLSKSFSLLIGAELVKAVNRGENPYFDVPDYLWDKICKNIYGYTDYEDFIMKLKSKEISYTTISRALLHIGLNITTEDIENIRKNNYGGYIRVLGFKNASKEIFTEIKKKSDVVIITKPKEYKNLLSEQGKVQFKQGLCADDLYRLCSSCDYKITLPNEFMRKLIVLYE